MADPDDNFDVIMKDGAIFKNTVDWCNQQMTAWSAKRSLVHCAANGRFEPRADHNLRLSIQLDGGQQTFAARRINVRSLRYKLNVNTKPDRIVLEYVLKRLLLAPPDQLAPSHRRKILKYLKIFLSLGLQNFEVT